MKFSHLFIRLWVGFAQLTISIPQNEPKLLEMKSGWV
jgi:hypothetical protein